MYQFQTIFGQWLVTSHSPREISKLKFFDAFEYDGFFLFEKLCIQSHQVNYQSFEYLEF